MAVSTSSIVLLTVNSIGLASTARLLTANNNYKLHAVLQYPVTT